jgi:hypothetical protein
MKKDVVTTTICRIVLQESPKDSGVVRIRRPNGVVRIQNSSGKIKVINPHSRADVSSKGVVVGLGDTLKPFSFCGSCFLVIS